MPKLKEILRDSARSAIFRGNGLLGRYEPTIWVVGHARSGTTWLADLLNYRGEMRDLFEPFHPAFTEEIKSKPYHTYIAPGEDCPVYRAFADRVFAGRYTCTRVDERNQRYAYRGLLVKDIFANLFLKWSVAQYPGIKKLFMVRHPLAVAQSKLKWYHHHWLKEPKEFLKQEPLMRDHLEPFRELIGEVETDFEKTILIWAVANYVPFRQLEPRDTCLVFYEDLIVQPEAELRRVYRHLRGYPEGDVELPAGLVEASTNMSRTGAPRAKEEQLNVWRGQFTPEQVSRAMEIIRAFGLDQLYNEDAMPRHAFAAKLLDATPA